MPIEWRVVHTQAELYKLLGEVEGIAIPDAPPDDELKRCEMPVLRRLSKKSKSSRSSKISKKSKKSVKSKTKKKKKSKRTSVHSSSSRGSSKSKKSKVSSSSKSKKKKDLTETEKLVDIPQPPSWWQGGKFQVQTYILFTSNFLGEFGRVFDEKLIEVEKKINDFLSYLPKRRKILMITVRLGKSMFGIGSELYNDPLFRVFDLPYLMRWRGPQRLYKSDCLNPRLLHLLFEDDFKHPERFRADTDSYLGSLVYPPPPPPSSPPMDDVEKSIGSKLSKGKKKRKGSSKGKKSAKSGKSGKKVKSPKKK